MQKKNIIVHRSGSYVANLVQMKNADAGLVWGAVALLRAKDLDSIPIVPEYLPVPYVDAVTARPGRPTSSRRCGTICRWAQRPASSVAFRPRGLDRARRCWRSMASGSEQLRLQEYLNGSR
jgi:hypothetical protein